MRIASPASTDRSAPLVAAGTLGVITALVVAGLVATALAGEALWPNSLATTGMYLFGVVGAAIAWRRPRNRIAWLCVAIASAFALEGALWGAALYGLAHPGAIPRPDVVAVVGDAFVMPGLFLIATLLVLLFPDGHLPSPRWRWLAWMSAILIFGILFVSLTAPTTGGWGRPTLENPLALGASEPLELIVFPAAFLCVGASIAALVHRSRQATGIVRLQVRWLTASGVAATITWIFAIFVVADLAGNEDAAIVFTAGAFMLIPIAIGVAVLRYRLFGIDRLISRTVTYVLVVTVLVGMYAGGVLLIGSLLPAQGDLAVAVSTLAVVAVFQPLRTRVRRQVDRRFDRSRYDAERELQEFSERLRDELDLDDLAEDLLTVVGDTMQPSTAAIWFVPGAQR